MTDISLHVEPPTIGPTLRMWVVYDHPRDHPHHYVARRWDIGPGGELEPNLLSFILCRDLEPIRIALTRAGFFALQRQPGDDAAILETWL